MDAAAATLRMSRAEYRAWAEGRAGRYELVRGEIVEMAAERAIHSRLKTRIVLLFLREIEARGLRCEAFADGMTVEVGPDTDYEPDVTVNAGERVPDEAIAVPNPVIVVEVASPGTRSFDAGVKLADYFRVASIQHYLIVRNAPAEVIHHRRTPSGRIETEILSAGTLSLDPPGMSVEVAAIFAGL